MSDEPQQMTFGLSTNLFATRKSKGESIVVGGTAADTTRWVRILSYRAAQLLWFQLTQLLHPEEIKTMSSMVMTAPMRDTNLPTITTHMNVEQKDGGYSITGWAGDKIWLAQLDKEETERFWNTLSGALYPKTSKPG